MIRSVLAFIAMGVGVAACDQRSATAAVAKPESAGISNLAGAASAPAVKVDSALPLEQELQRFRAGLPRVAELEHAAPSRDSLVNEFVAALQRADTAALVRLHITRAEYAWLVYPFSAYAHPPYHQPPDVAWMLAKAATETGLNRVLARRGGEKLGVVGSTCDSKPSREGENTIWRGCELLTASGSGVEATRQRLFGAIVERDGRFKFLSYKNQF